MLLAATVSYGKTQLTRDYVSVIAPRTIYPFLSVTSDRFGTDTQFKFPRIEITNTQTAFKLLCGGTGSEYPDLAMTNREMSDNEQSYCSLNNVNELAKVHLGYDAVSLASFDKTLSDILPEQLFLAVAGTVPNVEEGAPLGGNAKSDIESALIANPYTHWNQVDPRLPDLPISVYVPSEDTAAYDLFLGIALEGCRKIARFAALEARNANAFRAQCTALRKDDILQTYSGDLTVTLGSMSRAPGQLILVPQVALSHFSDTFQGLSIDGRAPTIDVINKGEYVGARPIYMYFRGSQYAIVPGLRDFITELTAKLTIGPKGYLRPLGFVPLSEEDRAQTRSILGDFDRQEAGIVDETNVSLANVSPKTRLRELDTAFWDWVRVTNDPDLIQVYINLLPDGVFARFARERVTLLRSQLRQAATSNEVGFCELKSGTDKAKLHHCWSFKNLQVAGGRLLLREPDLTLMQDLLVHIQNQPSVGMQIIGRTGGVGDEDDLSLPFAYLSAVSRYLVEAGVPADRIVSVEHRTSLIRAPDARHRYVIEIRTLETSQ